MNILLHGLYVITDPDYCGEQLVAKVSAALTGGANIIQYRNKLANNKTRQHEAEQLALLCKQHRRLFIVNDDIELALAVNTDGVHLGQNDLNQPNSDIKTARDKLGPNKIIGITCHQDLQLATQAQQHGADYVAFGCFFPSQTKPNAPAADINCLATARQSLNIPVVAIGGITPDNVRTVLNAGADMFAVIHAVMAQDDVTHAAKTFANEYQHFLEKN